MAKIARYNGNLEAPASAALGTERTIFGTGSQSDDLTAQFNAFMLRGWGIVGPSDQPTLQDFNAVGFTLGQIHAYLHQMGVAEYNAAQEYHSGSITNVAGVLYVSLIDVNVGNAPASSPSQWRGLNFGVGQTWQNVTASRASGVTYTNTTGLAISVSIYSDEGVNSVTSTISISVDGQQIARFDRPAATQASDGTAAVIVPPGSTYSATITGFVLATNAFWKELR